MNYRYPFGATNGHYNITELHADDRLGVRLIYPDDSTKRDISASQFHKSPQDHIATPNLVWERDLSSTTTDLTKGKFYYIEYTLENLGTETETPDVSFYLSTNSYISTGDRYLGRTAYNTPPGTVVTNKKIFYVANNIASGDYYIGYRVDPSDYIPESTGDFNNFVSLRSKATIQ